MKRLLAFLGLACGLAFLTGGAGTWPAGKTTYTFQQGVSPTSGYAGCEDTHIRYAAWTTYKNFGGSDSLKLASLAADSSESLILIKFKFMVSEGISGGTPANFVCTRARMSLYKPIKSAEAVAFTADDQIVYLYRSVAPWREGTGPGAGLTTAVSSVEQSADSSANTVWASPSHRWPSDGSPDGQSTNLHDFWRTGTSSAKDSSSTGSNGFFGADTVYSDADSLGFNIPGNPEASGYMRTKKEPPAAADSTYMGRMYFDVTHYVQGVLSGSIQNNGFVLTNSTSALVKMNFFASSENATSKNWRPMLEIEGYTISTSTTTVSRAIIGAGAGPGVH